MAKFVAPTVEELRKLSDQYGMQCTQEELQVYNTVLQGTAADYEKVYKMVSPTLPSDTPRSPGHKPLPQENKYNAWYWRCSLKKEGGGGKLAGKKVAIKDNVNIRGMPLMDGSKTLEGFVSVEDATIVRRLLEGGAEIVGKTVCEDLCLSGASYFTTYGPVINPCGNYSAGGSSSGSAVVVSLGEADMAIGGDQGGSIRIPASACGVVGLKPTWGLVPYTGIIPIETTIDHTGPMTRTVRDCALMLEAIAGFDDNRDCRQPSNGFSCPEYTKELQKPTGNLKLGVLVEGFELSTDSVRETVGTAIELIKTSGKFSLAEDVSIPAHKDGHHLWGPVGIQGAVNQMADGGDGHGTGCSGHLMDKFSEKLREGLKEQSHNLSYNAKFITMYGAYVKAKYGQGIYAKAATLCLELRRKYDEALKEYDALLLPTLTDVPCKLPHNNTPIIEKIGQSLSTITNTCPFNLTHHPALSLNAGFWGEDRLPVGLMIVGRHFDDATVLQIGACIEDILKPLQKK